MSSSDSASGATSPLEDIKNILEKQRHLFACGGHVPIRCEQGEQPLRGSSRKRKRKGQQKRPLIPSKEKRESDPITIRWDVTGTKTSRKGKKAAASTAGTTEIAKLRLPPLEPGAEAEADLNRLVQNSQPATFGRGGQDVFDESYRKAAQMDPDAFCTTFEPYSSGIIDTVAQMLLPSVSDSLTLRAVRADLYKLNIYSAPSGRFKPHVDTPRSPQQFGSLVVCLPVDHEGGQLKVRHKGEETTFDWSTNGSRGSSDDDYDGDDSPRIQWAAFYSDCEHEVLEVTSGHRLTLTYNLLAVRGAGRLTGVAPTLNPTQLPLYQALSRALTRDPFGGKDGTLGFWCSHVYAYNHKTETPLPATLKGVDAVLWESLRALGLEPKIAPVVKMSKHVKEIFSEWYDSPSFSSPTNPWAIRRRENLPSTKPSEWIVGHKFGVHLRGGKCNQVETLEDYHDLYQSWGSYAREPVHWLAKPKLSELQLVYTAYGNQASTGAMYSSCAIMVEIHSKRDG